MASIWASLTETLVVAIAATTPQLLTSQFQRPPTEFFVVVQAPRRRSAPVMPVGTTPEPAFGGQTPFCAEYVSNACAKVRRSEMKRALWEAARTRKNAGSA